MLSFKKSIIPPTLFLEAVAGITTYAELDVDEARKRKVLVVLLNEQGCLCPFCERQITLREGKRPATLDHFFPQSRFPELQINYFNLMGTCRECNSDFKKDHLVPSYVHDPQFDSTSAKIIFRYGNIQRHNAEHFPAQSSCVLKIPSYDKAIGNYKVPKHDEVLLKATIDFLGLNDRGYLKDERNEAYFTFAEQLQNRNIEQLLREWKKLVSGAMTTVIVGGVGYGCLELPEYLSLKIEILKRLLGKRGVNTYSDFQQRFDALL